MAGFDLDITLQHPRFILVQQYDSLEKLVGVAYVVTNIASAGWFLGRAFKPGDQGGLGGFTQCDGFEMQISTGGIGRSHDCGTRSDLIGGERGERVEGGDDCR